MKTLSILIGKIMVLLGRLLHRGSVLPGYYALKIDKHLLEKIKLPKNIIAVTGSNGKGSTSSLIVHILRSNGYKVTYNDKGSNLTNGITSAILEDISLSGKLKSDFLVMEVDERFTKVIFKNIKPKYVVITNIGRDQPPRQGHVDIVASDIKMALNKNMTIILNGDDPYLRQFIGKNIYYGIDKNKYSYTKNIFMNLDINYCPNCHSKLEYNYYNFQNDGDYYCSKCNFKKPNIDYLVTNIDYQNNLITVNNKYTIDMGYNILFSIYNTMAAFSLASILKLDMEKTIKAINDMKKDNKIYHTYEYKNRLVTVLNNKNENNSTFNQSLLYIKRFKDQKVIVIGWKEISRRYEFDDLSWLYDIDFEILNKKELEKVICVGIHAYDIATRIKLANIPEDKIVIYDTLDKATNYIKKKTKGNIYGILNFDYVKPFNELMEVKNDD